MLPPDLLCGMHERLILLIKGYQITLIALISFDVLEHLIFTPCLDINIIKRQCAECIDKGTRKTTVGDQWHV